MPALTDEEIAAVIDPALMQQSFHGDDEDALHSQLMADIEQNEFAHTLNGIVAYAEGVVMEGDKPVAKSYSAAADGVIADKSDAAQAQPPSGVAESGTSGRRPGLDSLQDHALEDQEVQMDRTDLEEDGDESASATEAPSDDEADNEEYEDASSSVGNEDAETIEVEQTQAPSEIGLDSASVDDDSDDATDEATDEELDSCIFCGRQDLTERSSEQDLSCSVCRRPAHYTCAVSQEDLIEDIQAWRCLSCSQSRTSESPKETANKPRHSAPRLVRDLLPVSRGMQKPGAHSIFAQPLIADEEGGRALRRKRKSPSSERLPKTDRKRKKLFIPDTPTQEKPDLESVSHSTRRSSQKLALGLPPVPVSRILQHRPFHKPPPHKFILAFRLEQSRIAAILSEPPRPSRKKYQKKKQKILPPPPYQPPVPKFPALPTQHLIFPSMFGGEKDVNDRPYGGILSDSDAETARSLPQMRDREIFESARKEAEEERKKTSAIAEAEINGLNGEGANATNSKRTVSGPPSKIKCIQFGKHVIDTSYAAPYPEEYSHESRLFICEFCLKYLPSEFVAWRHKLKCPAKHPPGDEIYRDGSLSIWEVDGRKKTEYCQCLCLMAKLFLGSKTLYYDVDPFLFYVLTEYDDLGYHFVGYFSKEKRPASQNNVSCILVMPIHQRKGYATFLIEFSYLLTRIEGKEGSPEKPLSDMGLTAYRSYWDLTISRHLLELGDNPFSVKDLMLRTGMTADDVVHSLERLYAFIKDPVTKTYGIRYDKKLYESIADKYDSKDFQKIRSERLVWTPYIMGRSDAATLDAAPITAVAQREDLIVHELIAEIDSDHISPKTSQAPSHQSPSNAMIDPALLNDSGNIAPGPPPTDAMDSSMHASAENYSLELVSHGVSDKGKAPAIPPLSGYALAHRIEKIPPTRFQIDPPIPVAILRHAKSKRRSIVGTPKANGVRVSKPATPQAVRSSPRKAGSVNGSVADRASSRATTPDKGSTSMRRSGRRSGLANEITNTESSQDEEDEEEEEDDDDEDEEEMDEIAVEDDEDEVTNARPSANQATTVGDSVEASTSEDETSGQSEGSSAEEVEDSDASDDPDAEVDDEDDEDDNSNDEEGEVEVDVLSAVSSAAGSEDGSSESTEGD